MSGILAFVVSFYVTPMPSSITHSIFFQSLGSGWVDDAGRWTARRRTEEQLLVLASSGAHGPCLLHSREGPLKGHFQLNTNWNSGSKEKLADNIRFEGELKGNTIAASLSGLLANLKTVPLSSELSPPTSQKSRHHRIGQTGLSFMVVHHTLLIERRPTAAPTRYKWSSIRVGQTRYTLPLAREPFRLFCDVDDLGRLQQYPCGVSGLDHGVAVKETVLRVLELLSPATRVARSVQTGRLVILRNLRHRSEIYMVV
ncbi:hypothetical protein BDK51DRAFT_41172 [Blyttiomyces helicus]|uniref:Uncharacterized protein n=1 Tax=Blyttiomyces helicus TaxID=388810 RepID=A0A4P9W7R7_9FUNG|nr:hypothetical protein BDK51DRAFT_41172 [Blyttiomyces helicus]|eukprot:RKO88531.1 hypothetical protein BDK51DRAFT_41172 [Blyttiomyces helicus]